MPCKDCVHFEPIKKPSWYDYENRKQHYETLTEGHCVYNPPVTHTTPRVRMQGNVYTQGEYTVGGKVETVFPIVAVNMRCGKLTTKQD